MPDGDNFFTPAGIISDPISSATDIRKCYVMTPFDKRYRMRLSKFVSLIVLGVSFIAGMAAHSGMVSHGISWRRVFGPSDPAEEVRNAIRSRQTSSQYVATRDFFAEFPGDANVVMFGDSQIAFADWRLLLGTAASNRGIYGETTAGALLRVDLIIAAHPKCVVTMLGIGDFAAGRNVESAAHDYSLILDRLVASGTEVIIQSTLPTEPSYSLNQKVMELNTKLKAACRSRCLFLDLDHIITPGSTIDGIHLKPETYKKWAEELKPIMAAHCGASQ